MQYKVRDGVAQFEISGGFLHACVVREMSENTRGSRPTFKAQPPNLKMLLPCQIVPNNHRRFVMLRVRNA